MGDKDLKRLIDSAPPMTPEQKERQRRSFVYGNTKLSNDVITREQVDQVDETNYRQIREVWIDQQDQYIEPTHCIEFYRAWGAGEIRRELRFGSTLTAYTEMAQIVGYMQNHSLAGQTLKHELLAPGRAAYKYNSIAQTKHESTQGEGQPVVTLVQNEIFPTEFAKSVTVADSDKTLGNLLDRFVCDVLIPDNSSVMQLLLQASKDNAVGTNCISMASLTYIRSSILKWRLVSTKLLATAKAIHSLMVELDSIAHSPKPKLREILGMELICTGGPADQTWIPDTPCIMVLADNIGARYMAEPWTASFTVKENKGNQVVSCRKVDEITNPRGIAVMWLVGTTEGAQKENQSHQR